MEYLKRRFTVPAGSEKIPQEEWDRIFGKEEPKKEEGGRREESCPESTDEPQTEE